MKCSFFLSCLLQFFENFFLQKRELSLEIVSSKILNEDQHDVITFLLQGSLYNFLLNRRIASLVRGCGRKQSQLQFN